MENQTQSRYPAFVGLPHWAQQRQTLDGRNGPSIGGTYAGDYRNPYGSRRMNFYTIRGKVNAKPTWVMASDNHEQGLFDATKSFKYTSQSQTSRNSNGSIPSNTNNGTAISHHQHKDTDQDPLLRKYNKVASTQYNNRADAVQQYADLIQDASKQARADVALASFQRFVKVYGLDSEQDEMVVYVAMMAALHARFPKRAAIIYDVANGARILFRADRVHDLIHGFASNRWLDKAKKVWGDYERDSTNSLTRSPWWTRSVASIVSACESDLVAATEFLDHVNQQQPEHQPLPSEIAAALIRVAYCAGQDFKATVQLMRDYRVEWSADVLLALFDQAVQSSAKMLRSMDMNEDLASTSSSNAAGTLGAFATPGSVADASYIYAGLRQVLLQLRKLEISCDINFINSALQLFVALRDPVGAAMFLYRAGVFQLFPEIDSLLLVLSNEFENNALERHETRIINAPVANEETLLLFVDACARSGDHMLEAMAIVELFWGQEESNANLDQYYACSLLAAPRMNQYPLVILKDMKTKGIIANESVLLRLLQSLANYTPPSGLVGSDSGAAPSRKQFLRHVRETALQCFSEVANAQGVRVSRRAYHALLDVIEKSGSSKSALALVDNMHLEAQQNDRPEVKPTASTYSRLLRTCIASPNVLGSSTTSTNMARAEAILDDMISRGIEPNDAVYSVMIEGFSKTLDLEKALGIWEAAKPGLGLPSRELCETMVQCCLVHPRGTSYAIEIVEQMRSAGILASSRLVSHYNALMSGLSTAQDMQHLFTKFNKGTNTFRDDNDPAQVYSGGRVTFSSGYVESMREALSEDASNGLNEHIAKDASIAMTDLTIGALMGACNHDENLPSSEQFTDKMKSTGLRPNEAILQYFAMGNEPKPRKPNRNVRYLNEIRASRGPSVPTPASHAALTKDNNMTKMEKLRQDAMREVHLIVSGALYASQTEKVLSEDRVKDVFESSLLEKQVSDIVSIPRRDVERMSRAKEERLKAVPSEKERRWKRRVSKNEQRSLLLRISADERDMGI